MCLHKTGWWSIKGAMIKVEFAQGWAPIFAGAGLKSFEDFFAYASGQVIGKNRKREVIAMTLDSKGGKKEFFMKRFFRPHLKDMPFTIRNFGKLCSQAGCEWKNIDILLRQGVATYRPVCYGEQIHFGLERKSFIITEKIKGLAMTDFVASYWPRLGYEQKEKLIIALAKFVGRIHNAKIILPDLYLWHIFITKTPPADDITEDDFAVIDLHRMRINASDKKARIKDLGALDFSMSDKYFDEGIREVFLDAYINTGRREQKNSVLRGIRNRSQKLSCRRRKPNY